MTNNFPFLSIHDCNSEPTQESLKSVAYVYLKHSDFSQQTLSKYARNLKPASRAILLSGPTGMFSGICDWIFVFLSLFDGLICFAFNFVNFLKNFTSKLLQKL